jgi:hypothetical protein
LEWWEASAWSYSRVGVKVKITGGGIQGYKALARGKERNKIPDDPEVLLIKGEDGGRGRNMVIVVSFFKQTSLFCLSVDIRFFWIYDWMKHLLGPALGQLRGCAIGPTRED